MDLSTGEIGRVSTNVRERPLPFTAPNAQLVYTGLKTQTRREIGLHPSVRLDLCPDPEYLSWPLGNGHYVTAPNTMIPKIIIDKCPYGRVGDRLWVREPWRTLKAFDDLAPRELALPAADGRRSAPIHYLGTGDSFTGMGKYRHARFMCRWMSRTLLQITDVRVELLQDISEADAIAEGVRELPLQAGEPGAWWTGDVKAGPELHGRTARDAYAKLWESINDAGSWKRNPYVYVITFRRIHA